jgi:hypothetical protein
MNLHPFILQFSLAMTVTGCLAIAGSTAAQARFDCGKFTREPNAYPYYRPEDLKAPMRFYIPEQYVCLGTAVNKPYLAVGVFSEATPSAFAEFASRNPPNVPIEFTSPGGNLLAALKLGEMIRSGGYDTSLGEFCASACAYAVMGGIKRHLVPEQFNQDSDYDNRNVGSRGTKLGIHQFYQADALNEPQKKAFSAIDRSVDQLLMGMLLEYTLRMGVDTHLVSIASTIPPWADIRWLTPEEMVAWKLDNTGRHYTDLVFRAFGRSGSYVEVTNIRGSDVSYLRIFCQGNVREPLFAFITDTASQEISPAGAAEHVRDVLKLMNMNLELGTERRAGTTFQIQDVQGIVQSRNKIRVSAVTRASGLARQDAERLTRVALEDNGALARSDWTFQDVVKFKIQGDRKLIKLAMKNCVD